MTRPKKVDKSLLNIYTFLYMNKLSKLSALAFIASASLIFTTNTFAFSLPGQGGNRPNGNGNGNTPSNVQDNRPVQALGNGSAGGSNNQATTARQAAQGRLQDAMLRACQAREGAILQRSTHLTQMATIMENTFDAISQRVETYYTTKVVPSGKTVSNYDALVSDIQTKKEAVQTALAPASTDATSFSCTSDDPKGQMAQFRTNMLDVITALQNYRISVKNLIVAVRSVVGVTNSTQNQASQSANQGGNQRINKKALFTFLLLLQ